MRARLPVSLLLASLAALPLLAADPMWERLAPPDANFAAGARPAELARSPLAQRLFAEAGQKQPAFLAAVGRQAMADVDRLEQAVVFAHLSESADASAPPAIALLSGDFADGWLAQAACASRCRQETAGVYELHLWQDDGEDNAIAFWAGRYALAGRVEQVRAALARLEAASPAPVSPLLEQAAALAGRHFWIAAEGPFEAPTAAGAPPFAAAALESLATFGLALDIDDDLELVVDVAGRSSEEGLRLHETVAGLLALAAASAEDAEQRALLEDIRLTRGSAGFQLALRVPQDDIERQIRAFAAPPDDRAPPAEPRLAKAATARPAPPPAERGVIRIYGLGPQPVVVGR